MGKPTTATILYCHCAYSDAVPEEVKQRVLAALRGSGVAFEAVADLCELSARRDPALKRIAGSGAVKIAACYPRAVRWLFAAAGSPLPQRGADVLNMRAESPERIIQSLLGEAGAAAGAEDRPSPDDARLAARGEWVPWFPVIDYDRCKGCKQCLSFCLFGVYGESADGRVAVQNPARCKTNCPACARVCPEAAIIFPKYPAGPINGDEVKPEDLQRQKMKVDVSKLIQQDVYEVLRARGKLSQPAGELDPDKALQERCECSCACDCCDDGGVIPLETLLSSPMLKELGGRAKEPEDDSRPPSDAPAQEQDPREKRQDASS